VIGGTDGDADAGRRTVAVLGRDGWELVGLGGPDHYVRAAYKRRLR
jgi:hypothetical protein